MPATYVIDVARHLVISTGSGVVNDDDIRNHHAQLRRDPAFDPTFDQLTDFTGVTKVELSSETVRIIASEQIFAEHSRRAVVAPTTQIFGLARMFQAYRELSGGKESVQIFQDREEALLWLRDEGKRRA